MRHGSHLGLAALALLAGALAPRSAEAFLVVAKAKGASADRVTVVALREGTHTVLSIQPRVRGPAGEVALLVPVPASVTETITLDLHALDPVQRVSAPRVVEYWELDPCELHDVLPSDGTLDPGAAADLAPAAPPAGAAPTAGPAGRDGGDPHTPGPAGRDGGDPHTPGPAGRDGGDPHTPGPAGGYAVQVSTATTGAELVASLKRDGYGVPDRVDATLDAYLKAGMRIVVARLDAGKLAREGDAAVLPPLQVHSQSESFTLPTRLLAAGGGRRELSLHVLSAGARFEGSGQPNVAVPTNLDVTDAVRAAPSSFYRALLDRTFEKSPGALVTEYAWRASACALCAAPLAPRDVMALGGSLLPSASGKQHEVLVEASAIAARPDGPPEVRAALMDCYAKALADKKDLAGDVSLEVEVGGDGKITSTSPVVDGALVGCVTTAALPSKGWKPGAKGTLTVKFAPVSRAFFADLVLTSLRARYEGPSDRDLALAPARAIEGGREIGSEGTTEKSVRPAPAGNNYQARYAVRHAFAGAIKCESPTRGTWGDPPKDAARPPPDRSKVPGAGAAGGRLEPWIQGDPPDFTAFAVNFGPPVAAPPPPPAASASPAPSASPSASPAPPATSSGCGACAAGSTAEGLPWAPLLAFAALARRRRSGRRGD